MIPHAWMPGDQIIYDGEVFLVHRDGQKVRRLQSYRGLLSSEEVCEGDAVNVSDIARQVAALQETVDRLEGR